MEKRITAKEKKEASRREPIDFNAPENKATVCNMFGCHEKLERAGLCKMHLFLLEEYLDICEIKIGKKGLNLNFKRNENE